MQSSSKWRGSDGVLNWLGAGAAAAALLIFAATAAAAAGRGDKPVSARARQGDAIFHQRCVVCHNKEPGNTSPFGPPNLHGIFEGPTALKTADAEHIITNGKGQMPAFGQLLTKSDIAAVIAYLKTQ
jgi:mono/diheme cytochrome c family protein